MPIVYKVQFPNSAGRSAGWSDPVTAGAGAVPPTILGLTARGTRSGVLLQWSAIPDGGEVLLQRTQVTATPPGANVKGGSRAGINSVTWLQAEPGNRSQERTIDNTALEGVTYRYAAVRRSLVRIGGHSLEMRSAPSTPVEQTWRDVYPPAQPQGLTAIGFAVPATPDQPAGYAVDLVWQPVGDPRLTGYLVYRQSLHAAGEPEEARQRLTPQPVTTPGFHDASASAAGRYRYSVTAIDPKGNESEAIMAEVQPAQP